MIGMEMLTEAILKNKEWLYSQEILPILKEIGCRHYESNMNRRDYIRRRNYWL